MFDKTGTLTAGKPAVVDFCAFQPAVLAPDALLLAAAVESNSEHPLGAAVVGYAQTYLLQPQQQPQQQPQPNGTYSGPPLPACRDVQVAVGQGISAWVQLPPTSQSAANGSRELLQSRAALLGLQLGDAGVADAAVAAAADAPAEVHVAVGSRRLMAAAGAVLPGEAEVYMQEQEVRLLPCAWLDGWSAACAWWRVSCGLRKGLH